MSSASPIVEQLSHTGNQTAVGIALFLKAILKCAIPGHIIVEHMNKEGATQVMMFGRQKLTTGFTNAIQIIRRDLPTTQKGYYTEDLTVTGALFFNGDGSVQTTPVLISKESWPELMAHVHKIFVRTAGA